MGVAAVVRLPDFLGLGTQKGGTTYCMYAAQHPQVQMAHPKELQFFSLHWSRGVAWYSRHLMLLHQAKVVVITPYLFHPLAPERIHAVLPNAELIVTCVIRLNGLSMFTKRLGLEPLDLEDALVEEPKRLANAEAVLRRGQAHKSHQHHSYLSRSRYEQQLSRFEKLFPASQLLILRSEDLFDQSQGIWERVLDFLELDSYPLPRSMFRYAGEGEGASVSPELRQLLRQQLANTFLWLDQR